MNQQIFTSSTARNAASVFLSFLWLAIGTVLLVIGIIYIVPDIDPDTVRFFIFPLFCLALFILYTQRTIAQLRLQIIVNPEGITINNGKNNSKTYRFGEYQVDANSSHNTYAFGLMSYLAGTRNELVITNGNGERRKVVTHLSGKIFKQLVDMVDAQSTRVEAELVKSMEGSNPYMNSGSKEYMLNRGKFKSNFIAVVLLFLIPLTILALLVSIPELRDEDLLPVIAVTVSPFFFLGVIILLIYLSNYRRFPVSVTLMSDAFYLNDKKFNLQGISKLRVNSPIKSFGAGFRKMYFTYEGKKYKYYLGRRQDVVPKRSILVQTEYKEIISYLKKQFSQRPGVMQADFK